MNQGRYFKKAGEKMAFTEEIADTICEGIASGLYLCDILAKEGMPHRVTVSGWRKTNPEFASAMEAAYEEQAENLEKECNKIIDDKSTDVLSNGNGGYNGNSAAVARSREQLNQRKFRMQTRAAHIYKPDKEKDKETNGGRLTIEIANPNGVESLPIFRSKDYKARGN